MTWRSHTPPDPPALLFTATCASASIAWGSSPPGASGTASATTTMVAPTTAKLSSAEGNADGKRDAMHSAPPTDIVCTEALTAAYTLYGTSPPSSHRSSGAAPTKGPAMNSPQHTAEGMHRGTMLVLFRLGTESVGASEAEGRDGYTEAVAASVTDGVRMFEREAEAGGVGV